LTDLHSRTGENRSSAALLLLADATCDKVELLTAFAIGGAAVRHRELGVGKIGVGVALTLCDETLLSSQDADVNAYASVKPSQSTIGIITIPMITTTSHDTINTLHSLSVQQQ